MVQAINEEERLLGVPYPSPSVTMRRVAEVSGGFCGYNQMSYAPRYAGAPYVVDGSDISVRVDEECDDTFATIVHEVAHTWFHGNDPADWIDEGLANAVETQVVVANWQGEVIYPPVTYCETYNNISELERGDPDKINEGPYSEFTCNYSLGDGIFDALREHHGDVEFNKRIAELARRESNETDSPLTIADIRRVLGGDGKALGVINLWYDGYPEMRKYRHLDAVKWSFAPTIDGDYLHLAGTLNRSGVVHDFVLGDDPYCAQFVLRTGVGDQKWVQNVSRPLSAGRTHHESSKVITINHDIDPDTGRFHITAKILGNALSSDRDLSLSVKERVATGEDGLCQESINYAQIPVAIGIIPAELKRARFFHLDAVEWTFPPTIDGEYLHFAGRTNEPELVHDLGLGDDPFCSQFVLYRNIINQEWVASVSDPLPVGWKHGEVPKVVVVNDVINPETGEFRVTAGINDSSLSEIPELSLLVRSRAEATADNVCDNTDSYSQVAVSIGEILGELKVAKHYHQDAIQWIDPPTISGDTLEFSGKAAPGTISLEWREGYCGQFSIYERRQSGYHYIDSLNLFLTGNRTWTGQITGEVTRYHIAIDGEFEATVRTSSGALDGYSNLVLVVKTRATVDPVTRTCGEAEVLSAIDIRRN